MIPRPVFLPLICRAAIKQQAFTPTHSLQGTKPACFARPWGQGGTVEQTGTEVCSTHKPLIWQDKKASGTVEHKNTPAYAHSRARMRNNHVPLFQCSKGVYILINQGLEACFAGTGALFHCSTDLKRGG